MLEGSYSHGFAVLPGLVLAYEHSHACELSLHVVPLCWHGPRQSLPELHVRNTCVTCPPHLAYFKLGL